MPVTEAVELVGQLLDAAEDERTKTWWESLRQELVRLDVPMDEPDFICLRCRKIPPDREIRGGDYSNFCEPCQRLEEQERRVLQHAQNAERYGSKLRWFSDQGVWFGKLGGLHGPTLYRCVRHKSSGSWVPQTVVGRPVGVPSTLLTVKSVCQEHHLKALEELTR